MFNINLSQSTLVTSNRCRTCKRWYPEEPFGQKSLICNTRKNTNNQIPMINRNMKDRKVNT
ncbi:hypothetical protein HanPSC8_Chr13g0555661 [Helianthus annuus]|nr:hypothetical protein HanPSC8_Chr13g0555661 [Helianthus annuus]